MSNQRLPLDQWVNRPKEYTDKDEFLKLERTKHGYYCFDKVRTCLLRIEVNTWGVAAVRDDNVAIAYWRDPSWRPNGGIKAKRPPTPSYRRKFTEM